MSSRSLWLNSAKPPAALVGSGEYSLTLLLSTHDDYVSQTLGSITLPSSVVKPSPRGRHNLPPRQGEPAFQPQPELFHTFDPEEKQIGFLKSALGTVFVLAPWLLLAVLVSASWYAYGAWLIAVRQSLPYLCWSIRILYLVSRHTGRIGGFDRHLLASAEAVPVLTHLPSPVSSHGVYGQVGLVQQEVE